MAAEGSLHTLPGLSASADLSAKQFYCMKISGANTVTVCAAVTDKVIGILQDTPTSGQPASVAFSGRTKGVAGGTVSAGNLLGTKNDGTLVAIVAGTDTTQYVVGQALTAAVSGDIFDVYLMIGGRAA